MSAKLITVNCGCEIHKKQITNCIKCGEGFCPKHSYYYVDEANIAITRNSKPYCNPCYLEHYKPYGRK